MFTFPTTLFTGSSSNTSSWAAWNGSADGSNQNTTISAFRANVTALSATTFIVVMPNGSNLYAQVGTISGTSVSYGTAVNLNATGLPAGANIQNVSVTILNTNKILAVYNTSSGANTYAVVATISGDVVTPGNVVFATTDNGFVDAAQQLSTITTSTALYSYRISGNIRAVVLSISGTSITVNTPATIVSGVSSTPSTTLYTTGKILLSYNNAGSPYAVIVNVSGTSIGTIGTPAQIESTTLFSSIVNLAVINSSQALASYSTGSGTNTLRACVLSFSGNTVTANTPASISSSANLTNVFVEPLNNTEFMASYSTSSTPVVGQAKILTVSGTTVSAGSQVTIQSSDSGGTVEQNISKIDGNTVINAVVVSGTAYTKVLKRS